MAFDRRRAIRGLRNGLRPGRDHLRQQRRFGRLEGRAFRVAARRIGIEGNDRHGSATRIGLVDQRERLFADGGRARPTFAGQRIVFGGAHRTRDAEQLHAHAELARFVVQYAHEHADGRRRDGTMAVTRPRILAAGAADHDIATIAAGFGQQRNQMPRGGKLRHQIGPEAALQFVGGMVEHATRGRFAAGADDDAGDRPVEFAQGGGKRSGTGFVRDRTGDDVQVRAGMMLAQRMQFGRIERDGDDGAAFVQRGLHHTAAGAAGGVQDNNRRFHRPISGTLLPTNGMIRSSAVWAGVAGRGDADAACTATRRTAGAGETCAVAGPAACPGAPDKAESAPISKGRKTTGMRRSGDMEGSHLEQVANLVLRAPLD